MIHLDYDPGNFYKLDQKTIDKDTSNIYKSITIVAKRANDISMEMKQELEEKIKQFENYSEFIEEIVENFEQIQVARHFERINKPNQMALQEWVDGKLDVKDLSEIEEETTDEILPQPVSEPQPEE